MYVSHIYCLPLFLILSISLSSTIILSLSLSLSVPNTHTFPLSFLYTLTYSGGLYYGPVYGSNIVVSRSFVLDRCA